MIRFQKLVGNLDYMTNSNFDTQEQKPFDSYFKSSWKYMYLFGVIIS